MNYYEELGVGPQATELEIRKAHRRRVKLMHPDAQLDPIQKAMAETQMLRLNSIVSTLLDPDRRRAYDQALDESQGQQSQASSSGSFSWQGIPWWLPSAVGAVVLTLVALWFWADHMGTTFRTQPRTVLIPPVGDPVAESVSSNLLPNPASQLPAPPNAAKINRDPLEGEWLYTPKQQGRHRAGVHPPEFIHLKLFSTGEPGNLEGEYIAKYIVTDKPVSPEVSFQLASASKGSRQFVWHSNDGAKGTLSIDPINDRTIRIDWHTTSSPHVMALTSDQATLVRGQ